VLEYGILAGGKAGDWFANLQHSASSLVASPFFWPGVGLAVLAAVFLYKLV
jgi:hypothetical protein